MILTLWIILGLIVGWIGGCMVASGDNGFVRWLGLVIAMFAGAFLLFIVGTHTGYVVQPDKDKCSQYVWVDDTLTCVPNGEEG